MHCTCSLQAVAFNCFVYSVLLFSSYLLGTAKRVLFVPHSQRLKITLLLLLSECCSLLEAAGREVGRSSAVPRGLSTAAAGRETTQNQHTCSSPQVPVSPHCSPQGTAIPCLCFSFPASTVCWEHPCASISQHQGLGAALPGAVQPSSNPQAAQL